MGSDGRLKSHSMPANGQTTHKPANTHELVRGWQGYSDVLKWVLTCDVLQLVPLKFVQIKPTTGRNIVLCAVILEVYSNKLL